MTQDRKTHDCVLMEEQLFLNRHEVKKILVDLNVIPRRRLGQSFLVDQQALRRIVNALDLNPKDIVFEIGPGLGALTGFLLNKVKKVLAIELDEKLHHFLKERFRNRDNLFLLNEDILKTNIEVFLKNLYAEIQSPAAVKVVGNLPYRISSQVLFKFLECPVHPERMVLAFQWEVAERLTASPNSKDYGALTLITQFYADVKRVFRIKKASFYPEPEVDTGIVAFHFRSLDLGLRPGSAKALFEIIKLGFAQRRKTFKNALTNSGTFPYTEKDIEKALARCNLDLKIRAENLTLSDFAKILKALEEDRLETA